MTRRIFHIGFKNKGFISTYLLHKAAKGNSCKQDIIRLKCRNSEGNDFIHVDVTPKEALYIADALLHAVNRKYLQEARR